MKENKFQAELIQDLHELFPDCIVLKNDPNYLQGFPDLLILYNKKWAALETKRNVSSNRQPNQEYYIFLLNDMSYASFIYPRIKEKILDELQQAFRSSR